ncbi:MAG: DUF2809 domain-containing protein [Microcoleaceae cyanobacterium]
MNQYRFYLLLSLIVITILGFTTKFYRGSFEKSFENWINNSFSSIFYELFWVFLVILIWPRFDLRKVVIGVLMITSGLEILQLWNPPILAAIRATLIGRLFLGTTFSAWDFLYYGIGCAIAWWCLQQLKSRVIRVE